MDFVTVYDEKNKELFDVNKKIKSNNFSNEKLEIEREELFRYINGYLIKECTHPLVYIESDYARGYDCCTCLCCRNVVVLKGDLYKDFNYIFHSQNFRSVEYCMFLFQEMLDNGMCIEKIIDSFNELSKLENKLKLKKSLIG